nr:hypothetical protein [Azohydromonas australica]
MDPPTGQISGNPAAASSNRETLYVNRTGSILGMNSTNASVAPFAMSNPRRKKHR